MRKHEQASDDQGEIQQATTTSFDVIETQAILRQLTGNCGGEYRLERKRFFDRLLQRIRSWFKRDR